MTGDFLALYAIIGFGIVALMITAWMIWIVISRLMYGFCVFLAMTARMTEERENRSNPDWMSLADAYYDHLPFVQH